jgi:hypothetical protein
VWLWPDRDGIDQWRNLRDKLGSDKIQIYTEFFDRCYIPEEDGPKADVADIAIRLMGGGRVPEQKTDTGDGQGATDNNAPDASYHSGAAPAPTPEKQMINKQANSLLSTLHSQLQENPAIQTLIDNLDLIPVRQ